MSSITIERLGRRDYRKTWEYQRSLFSRRLRGDISDTLLLVEHDPVYTVGKSGADAHIPAGRSGFGGRGIPVVHVDRGGDVTFHGPGQLVGYPILNLGNYYRDVHRYLRDIEEVLILTLGDFGIDGQREEGYTGVWVNGEKVAAIGVKTSRWITMHGFALNVSTDLRYFENIVPCGIEDRRVTSMRKILSASVAPEAVADAAAGHFTALFALRKAMAAVPAGQADRVIQSTCRMKNG